MSIPCIGESSVTHALNTKNLTYFADGSISIGTLLSVELAVAVLIEELGDDEVAVTYHAVAI